MHISCSYEMSYVLTFDIWEVKIMSFSGSKFALVPCIKSLENWQRKILAIRSGGNHENEFWINEDKHFEFENSNCSTNTTRHVSLMIPSARPTVPSVVMIIIFTRRLVCFVIYRKVGTNVRTEICEKMITTGRVCGSTEWINIWISECYYPILKFMMVLNQVVIS